MVSVVSELLTGKVWVVPSVLGQLLHQEVRPSALRFFLQASLSWAPWPEENCSQLHPPPLWSLPDLLSLCLGCLELATCPGKQQSNSTVICSNILFSKVFLKYKLSHCPRVGKLEYNLVNSSDKPCFKHPIKHVKTCELVLWALQKQTSWQK